jgi:hypothetical protein
VIYKGDQFVKIKGQKKKQIPANNVVKLLRKFYEIDFFFAQKRIHRRTKDFGQAEWKNTGIHNDSRRLARNLCPSPYQQLSKECERLLRCA